MRHRFDTGQAEIRESRVRIRQLAMRGCGSIFVRDRARRPDMSRGSQLAPTADRHMAVFPVSMSYSEPMDIPAGVARPAILSALRPMRNALLTRPRSKERGICGSTPIILDTQTMLQRGRALKARIEHQNYIVYRICFKNYK